MNKTKSIQDWDKWVQSEEYQKLDKKQNEYRDKKEEILELRTEIFNKLNLDDEDKNNIVELIHNVVHWREVNMLEVKTTLQKSFSPELKKQVEDKLGDVEWD
jgi:hypothetical protein